MKMMRASVEDYRKMQVLVQVFVRWRPPTPSKPHTQHFTTSRPHRHGWLHPHAYLTPQALESFQRALDIDPENDEAKTGLRDTIRKINETQHVGGEADPERHRRAMEDPEVQAILTDPMVNAALEDMQRDPGAMRRIMADAGMAAKIQKLIAAGVLRTG